MNSFLIKFIKRNKNLKTMILKRTDGLDFSLICPKEVSFFNNGIIPMIKERSLLENRVALETIFRKELISIAKENKIYKDCPRGTNYFLTEKDGMVIKHIVKVVNNVDDIKFKDFILNKSMEILDSEEARIKINLFSYFNAKKEVYLIEKKGTLIKASSTKENIEIDLGNFIDIEKTKRINEKINEKTLTENDYRNLALNTILRDCSKCIYKENCKLFEE